MRALYNLYERVGLHTAAEGTYVRGIDNVIRRLAGKQPAKQFPVLRKDPSTLNVLSLCGIGDVLWSLIFIPALLKRYNKNAVRLVVHFNGDHRSGRSFDLLRRLDYVDDVVPFPFRIHRPVPIDSDGYLDYTYTAGPAVGAETRAFDYALIVNTFLERGWSIEQIAQHLELDESLLDWHPFSHFNWKPEDAQAAQALSRNYGQYAVFYLGAEVDNTIGGLNCGALWTPEDWVRLLKLVTDRSGKKIVVIGAPYDLSYFKKVMDADVDGVLAHTVNLIGMLDLPATLAVLRDAAFVVGFASGMPISSTYLRTKTAIFWRPQELSMSPRRAKYGFHKEFATNWVPREMLESRSYLDLWYTKDTPESIVARMDEAKWF